jgi:hypothetical protein
MWVAPSLASQPSLAAIAATRVNRPTEQLALEVDTQLNLREKLSTALHCRHRDDPFAQAAVEDAIERGAQSLRARARQAYAFSRSVAGKLVVVPVPGHDRRDGVHAWSVRRLCRR